MISRRADPWAARLGAAVLALACAGCATPVPPGAGSAVQALPPTVTLPISMAGITDARLAFAALFDQELQARTASPPAREDAWLHGVSPRTGDQASRLAAIGRAYRERAAATSVLLIPGMFADCVDTQSVPFGDGLVRTRERSAVEAYAQYADLGLLGIRTVLLPGRASSATNGALVAQAIRDEAARPGVRRIVLIGYSKGVPDAMQALAQLQADGGVPPAVSSLVSVSGVVMGTPIADRFERLYEVVSPLVQPLDCSASDGHDLTSLTRHERVAWLVANPLPQGLRTYSVTAHAARDEIGPLLRPFHAQLSAVDARNDGQMLASEAILPGSVLLAEARTDHWDVALPRDRHPNPLFRATTSGRAYPREALFRALVRWVVGVDP